MKPKPGWGSRVLGMLFIFVAVLALTHYHLVVETEGKWVLGGIAFIGLCQGINEFIHGTLAIDRDPPQ